MITHDVLRFRALKNPVRLQAIVKNLQRNGAPRVIEQAHEVGPVLTCVRLLALVFQLTEWGSPPCALRQSHACM